MRIALISDLHGNDVALTAVLDDIERAGVDRLVCLGDVATLGPHPSAVITRLRELGCACIIGNHDAFMLDPDLIHTYTEAPIIVEAVDWCRAELRPDEIEFLRSFQPTIEIEVDAQSRILLFHGTPRSHMEDMLATTAPDDVDRMLDGHTATVLAGGHTHIQMLRQHRGMLLVNPGSLGMPFQEYVAGKAPTLMMHAEYAVVDVADGHVSVALRRVPLDRKALREATGDSKCPLAPMLAQAYA